MDGNQRDGPVENFIDHDRAGFSKMCGEPSSGRDAGCPCRAKGVRILRYRWRDTNRS